MGWLWEWPCHHLVALAAAGLSPALGLFLPVQREVVSLPSDALSVLQSAGTIQ